MSPSDSLAVEMALIFPLLFLIVLGAAGCGRALDLKIEVTGASRAGMRTGIAGGPATSVSPE